MPIKSVVQYSYRVTYTLPLASSYTLDVDESQSRRVKDEIVSRSSREIESARARARVPDVDGFDRARNFGPAKSPAIDLFFFFSSTNTRVRK